MQQYWACSSQSKTCGPKGRPHHPEKQCRHAPEKQAVRWPRLPTPSRPRKPGTRTQSTPPLHRHHTAQHNQLPADGRTLLSQAPQNKSSTQGQRQRVQQLPPFSSFPVTRFAAATATTSGRRPSKRPRTGRVRASSLHPRCLDNIPMPKQLSTHHAATTAAATAPAPARLPPPGALQPLPHSCLACSASESSSRPPAASLHNTGLFT